MEALSRYRIIDMGNVLAGPLVSQLMADVGADVVKVETRTRLDGTRRGRPIVGEDVGGGDRGLWPELQPLFHALNRNKLGVTINLKEPQGVGLVKDLARVSDALITNFSPGVMDRMGLGYRELRQARPDLIVVSMPGAGESGPLREMLTYASITAALSGLMGLIGYPPGPGDGEEGTLAGQTQGPWCDVVASLNTLVALLAALCHRNETGEGQYVEVAQLEASVSLLGEPIMEYAMTGEIPALRGTRHPTMAPHGNYPCQGDDRWVSIAVKTQAEWDGLCKAMGYPPWASDPRFADGHSRSLHLAELDRHISQWTLRHSAEEAADLLQDARVAAVPVMNIEDQFTSPQFQERQAFVDMEHPMVGTEWLPGFPWQLSRTPGSARSHAPLMGQHTQEVLQGLLGFGEARYRELEEAGVLE